jgi:hypothetical protein
MGKKGKKGKKQLDPEPPQPPSPHVMDESAQKRLGDCLQKLVKAPWPKGSNRKDMTWWNKAHESRERLADLWRAVRVVLEGVYNKTNKSKRYFNGLMPLLFFDQRPEHLAHIQQEKTACEQVSAQLAAVALEELFRSEGLEVPA